MRATTDTKASAAAAKAAERGLEVWAYRQKIAWLQSGFSGEVGGIGEAIGAIESQGWRLDHMAFDGEQGSHGGCILLFRRARPAPPPQQPQPGYGWPQR